MPWKSPGILSLVSSLNSVVSNVEVHVYVQGSFWSAALRDFRNLEKDAA